MRTINKSDVAHSLLLECMSEINNVKDKLQNFTKKYSSSFNDFEKKIKKSKKENFSEWDDYMEWKSYENVLSDLSKKIKYIKGGNFKVT